MRTRTLAFALVFSLGALAADPAVSLSATITIINVDGAGQGFNDTTVVAPVGGNPGTTLGEQRLNAFQYAADIWGNILDSDIEIVIGASFSALSCDSSGAILGQARSASLVSG